MKGLPFAILLACLSKQAFALPTMIRLGYPTCVSCHVNPQGRGILNPYGKGIDEAQSLRGREYQPSSRGILKTLSWNGRINQDVRAVASLQLSHAPGGPYMGVDRYRLSYRNVTTLTSDLRVSAVVDGETESANRPGTIYDPTKRSNSFAVRSALVEYLPKEGIDIIAGIDALPIGLNIPDQTTFIYARNRLGYYDTHPQAKAFFWGKRWQVTPYVFAPTTGAPATAREKGAGILAEYDLLGKGRTIVGIHEMHGSDSVGHRRLTSVYARLGFGGWGVLAEHNFTDRKFDTNNTSVNFGQRASYAQVFYYPREWFFISAVIERLSVDQPYEERLWAIKGDLSLRLSANWSIAARSGVQRNAITGGLTPIASIQLSAKSVN